MSEVNQAEITITENEELKKLVTNAEIKNVVFGMGKDKSCGPDGFTTGFFHKYWDIVGPSMIKVVKGFFSSGRILK